MTEKTKETKNLLTRRDTLRLMGAAGATALVGFLPAGRRGSVIMARQLSCVVRPELTEGPYFVDERLNRSDIRSDPTTGVVKAGVPLTLAFNVSRVNGSSCEALAGAYVDLWHCDALGLYSDVSGAGQTNTVGQKFLRGYQVTNSSGAAQFLTIYPGWYQGRAVHMHFKIRLFTGSQTTYEFTSQLFFDEAVTDLVHAQAPYNTKGTRDTFNSEDNIFNSGGAQLILNLTQSGQGYAATFNIGLEGVEDDGTGGGGAAPVISSASVSGKRLTVTGQNFDDGADLLLNGERQKKTDNDATNPTTVLVARKSGRKIVAGSTYLLQVRNSDGTFSNEFMFTRPA